MSWPVVVVVFGCTFAIIHLYAVVESVRKDTRKPTQIMRELKSWMKERFTIGAATSITRVDREASKLLAEHMFVVARNTVSEMAWSMEYIVATMLITVLLGSERWMLPLMDASILLMFLALLVAKLFPSLFRQGGEAVWYSIVMFLACVAVCPVAMTAENLLLTVQVATVLRISACSLSPCIYYVILWNILYSLVSCFTLSQGLATCDGSQRVAGGIHNEIFTSLFISLHYSKIKNTMARAAWHEIEAMDAKNDCAAVIGLLNTMSDAVVKLDEDLLIEEHSPKLSGMLLHGSKSLVGVPFKQFLATEEDRVRFAECVEEKPHEAESLADAFHSVLHDSMNNLVKVEIFHVCFTTLGERLRHFLGVKEHGDVESAGQQTFGSPDCVDKFPEPASALSVVNVATHASVAFRESVAEPIGLLFSVETMRIKACSDTFARLVGVTDVNDVVGIPLTTWLPPSVNSDFSVGYPAMLDAFRERNACVLSRTFKVVMRIPHSLLLNMNEQFEVTFAMKVTIRQDGEQAGNGVVTDASAILKDMAMSRVVGNARSTASSASRTSTSRSSCSSRGTKSSRQFFYIGTHEPAVDDARDAAGTSTAESL